MFFIKAEHGAYYMQVPKTNITFFVLSATMCPGIPIRITMVKQRMSTADVAGEVACLRHSVLGMRVANVYDVNSKVRPV